MVIAAILILLLLAGPISVLFGETRFDPNDRRGWWPGVPRR